MQTWPKTTFDNRIVGFIYRTWKNVRLYHRKITRKFEFSINRTLSNFSFPNDRRFFYRLFRPIFSVIPWNYDQTNTHSESLGISFNPNFSEFWFFKFWISRNHTTHIWHTYVWIVVVFVCVNYSLNTCKQVLMNLY